MTIEFRFDPYYKVRLTPKFVYVLCSLHPQGIACNLESPAFKFLHQATLEVIGNSEPHSVCGGLPLVRDLQD